MSKSITQDMAYRQSLMKYAEKYGVSRASRKYNKAGRIFTSGKRAGTAEGSLSCQSRRPHSHPNEHTPEELKLDPRYAPPESRAGPGGIVAPTATARLYPPAGEFVPGAAQTGPVSSVQKKPAYKAKPYEQMTYPGQRVQVDVKVVPGHVSPTRSSACSSTPLLVSSLACASLAAYPEQSTYSSADFLKKLFKWYAHRGIRVECVQTDNGSEFTNRFLTGKQDRPTLFEVTAAQLNIRHKLIRPYTPRHNGKMERSHREDQKRFYSTHTFFSLDDFVKQLAVHNRRSNNFPMRPMNWLSPLEFTVQYV